MNKLIYAALFFLLSQNSTFAHTNLHTYITNAASPGSISMCEIHETTGQFTTCDSFFIDELATPLDIALTTIANKHHAYITNSNYPALVTHCQVAEQGQLQACMLTDVPSYAGIAFHESDQLYAYLSHTTSVQKCPVGKMGQLEAQHCSDSGAGPMFTNGPIYITFKTFNHKTYAYIANGDYKHHANVVQCFITEQGDFANCIDAGAGAYFDGAADIDFAILSGTNYAYITESGGGIAKCHVDANTGLFSSCAPTGGDFATPLGMTFKTIAGTLYAYIVDGGFHTPPANTVSQCAVDTAGDLNCTDAGLGAIFANPFGIF